MKLSVSTTQKENLLGWGYWLISLFVLPFALDLVSNLLPVPLSDTGGNLVFFAVNFLAVTVIFRRFLASSVRQALNTPWHCLRFAALGLALYFIAMWAISQAIVWCYPDFSNVNDDAIADLAGENYSLWAFGTIFLVPVTEELLHRGLVFQNLQRRSRPLAYCASTFAFSFVHILGYIGTADALTLALCFAQYLPAGLALAWAYERADTIVAPMLIHITINQIGMSALR